MKDFKFKSNSKLDSMIQSILASSRFSSFQEYIEWRISKDYSELKRKRKLE